MRTAAREQEGDSHARHRVCPGVHERAGGEWCQPRRPGAEDPGLLQRNGWQCVEVVRDDGYSAKDLKRPGLQQVLEEVPRKSRRFLGIVVTKLDRLTRSVRDLVSLTDLVDQHQVALVSIQEAVDTGTATGQLFRNIITSINEDSLLHSRSFNKNCGLWPLACGNRRPGPCHTTPARS